MKIILYSLEKQTTENESSKNNYDDVMSRIMKIKDNGKIISFAGGIPSPSLFPKDEFEKVQINLSKSKLETSKRNLMIKELEYIIKNPM